MSNYTIEFLICNKNSEVFGTLIFDSRISIVVYSYLMSYEGRVILESKIKCWPSQSVSKYTNDLLICNDNSDIAGPFIFDSMIRAVGSCQRMINAVVVIFESKISC